MNKLTGTMSVKADGSFEFQFNQSATLLHGQAFKFTLELLPDMQAMRRIRLRAWRQVQVLAARMSAFPPTSPGYDQVRKQYHDAMETVQTLNDLFPLGDTAEHDDHAMRAGI